MCVGVSMDRKWVDEWTDGWIYECICKCQNFGEKQAAPIFTITCVFSGSVDSQNCYLNLLYF